MSEPGLGPVELIVPFPPGGVADAVGVCLARALGRYWRAPVAIRHVSGGGGADGMLALCAADPDGSVAMLAATGQITQNPAIDPGLPYRWDSARPVARVSSGALAIVVRADDPATDLASLLARGRADPTVWRIGTSGQGGASLLAVGRLLAAAGIDLRQVRRTACAGGAAILEAVLDGRSDFAAQYVAEMGSLLAQGRLRALAVSGERRCAACPGVPAAAECGYPDFDLRGWTGLMLPPEAADAAVERWMRALAAAAADPAFVADMAGLGAEIDVLGLEAFRAALAREHALARATALRLGLAR